MRLTIPIAVVFSLTSGLVQALPLEVEEVTVAATHRIYKDYRETLTVKMGERFVLSDTEFSAEAVEFLPDFAINVEKEEVISRSDEPNNPAVRIVVYQNDERVDEVWAFRGKGAPHFYRDSFLAFELLDYKIKEASSSPSEVETESDTTSNVSGLEEETGELEE